ncbi:MAG: homoserine kinase [Rubrivivax sp.]|jgi:homoserine kinase type II|nr:homoserine kinase [Rubrivivax sp.]
MAVYTSVDHDAAAHLFQHLGLGRLLHLQGIGAGIENTNYFATTEHGDWVLTLFERLPAEQLPYFLGLMQHLAHAGLPVPSPQAAPGGSLVHTLAGKPAAVVTRLPGRSLDTPSADACEQLGAVLAQLHLAGASYAPQQAHERGLAWWGATLPQVLPHVPTELAQLLRQELAHQQRCAATPEAQTLPRGPIHADVFRDNVLFTGGAAGMAEPLHLSGLFDFYFAGTDTWLFDVAVCLNDWCLQADSATWDAARFQALLKGYQSQRRLTPAERHALPDHLRAAALRFWISRLWDWYLPREATLLTPKNPGHFERVLRERIDNPQLPDF